MNNFRNVHVLVEGATEGTFIRGVLAPYCLQKGVIMQASELSKKGQKGGDIKFSRCKNEIRAFLKQRSDQTICTFIDYYGVTEWPGTDNIPTNAPPARIADEMNRATIQALLDSYPELSSAIDRYVPFTAVHEFETLLFSDATILAQEIGVKQKLIDDVLEQFGEPERINNSPNTAPSKRLLSWYPGYAKVRHGTRIASAIGIDKMRHACPLFNAWLLSIGVPE